MHYQYHDGLLEQASLDASDRSAVLTFLLYAVFDRTRARVSLRFEGSTTLPPFKRTLQKS